MEEDQPRPAPVYMPGQDLSDMSVGEIDAVISTLEAEITRLREARDSKAGHLDAAQALFSKP